MNLVSALQRKLAGPLRAATLILATLLGAAPAQAYVLTLTSSCTPGARWSTSLPVKVKLLADSFTAYVALSNKDKIQVPNGLTAAALMIDDIKAVINEYNAVPGSALKLEYAGSILGDGDMNPYPQDSVDTQTIVVGFSSGAAPSNESAPAWTPTYPAGACTITRAQVFVSNKVLWSFGPPPSTDSNGKVFGGGYAFRAVLLHEMGHAVGLAHETDAYAVMDHGTKAWTRGGAEVPQMELLPDDSLGLLKLYGGGTALQGFDVSLTNTNFQTAEQLTQLNAANDKRHGGCGDIEASLATLQDRRQQQLAVLPGLQGAGHQAAQAQLDAIEADIATQEKALWECRYRETTAQQLEQCRVSSRGDSYVLQSDASQPFCGVNDKGSSAFATVGDSVCPGQYVQVRYTANNKSAQDVQLQEQLWFSADEQLKTYGAEADFRSPDLREFLLSAGRSASLGRMYRVPVNLPAGRYKVFAQVFASNPTTGTSLTGQEADSWNNAIRLHGTIQVGSAGCP